MGILKRITDEEIYDKKREEDIWGVVRSDNPFPVEIVVEEGCNFLDEDKDWLQDWVSLDFNLGGYKALGHMLNSLGVKVIIRKGILEYESDFLVAAEAYWRKRLSREEDKAKLGRILEEIAIERKFLEGGQMKGGPLGGCAVIRGRYLHLQKEKIIELFPDAMKDTNSNFYKSALATTLVHEAMHAYFDRSGHENYPYAYFVEEPMAEFGMLLFINEAKNVDRGIREWAQDDVSKKSSCYRYGVTLYNQYKNWNNSLRDYLEAYKYGVDEYEMLDVSNSGDSVALPCPKFQHPQM